MNATIHPMDARTLGDAAYPPSWVDRVHGFLDRLPFPAWSLYALAWLACFALQTTMKWLDGTYAVGTFSLFHFVFSGSAVYVFACMHYLDRVAERGLEAFEPALDVAEDERARILHRLTTLPAGPVLGLTLAGAAWAVLLRLTFVRPYLSTLELATSARATVVDAGLLMLFWSVVFVLVFHTAHQLRTVSGIYRNHARIDLFKIRPLYAFSPLAARTAIAMLLLCTAWLATAPGVLHNVVILALAACIAAVATFTFVAPLAGILQRLREEKQRLLDEHHLRAQETLARFHQDLAAGDLAGMDGHNKAVATLELEHARLTRMPVWPWSAATLRGLVTAVFLPLLVWGTQQVLLRMI